MSRRKTRKYRDDKLTAITRSSGTERARLVAEGRWTCRPVVFRDKRFRKLERVTRKEVGEW